MTKLQKQVKEWWEDLEEQKKSEIIDNLYRNAGFLDADEAWRYLDWKIKLEIYRENNPGAKV